MMNRMTYRMSNMKPHFMLSIAVPLLPPPSLTSPYLLPVEQQQEVHPHQLIALEVHGPATGGSDVSLAGRRAGRQ